MKQDWFVKCFAANDSLFTVDSQGLLDWTSKVLASNLTYFRLRRELHEEFVLLMHLQPTGPVMRIGEEPFIVIKYFLTARNDALDDNKRLSFDKAIFQLRNLAFASFNPPVPAITTGS